MDRSPPKKQRKMDHLVPANNKCIANNTFGAGDVPHTTIKQELQDENIWQDHSVAANNECIACDIHTTIKQEEKRQEKDIKIPWFGLDTTNYDHIVKTVSFVDKTMLIKKLFNNPEDNDMKTHMKKVLIMTPRRFGKTTNMEMVKTFLKIKVDRKGKEMINVEYNKDNGKWIEKPEMDLTNRYKLFKKHNLLIHQCQHEKKHTDEEFSDGLCEHRLFFYKHCGTHPVIHVDFNGVKCDTKEKLLASFRTALKDAFQEHWYLQKSNRLSESNKKHFLLFCDEISRQLTEEEIIDGLRILSTYLYMHFNKRAYVLIDEFDAPIRTLLVQGTTIFIQMIKTVSLFTREVISRVLKSNDKFVEGALLNACYRLCDVQSPSSVNIRKCQFLQDHEFAVHYGFTETEVQILLNKPEFAGINHRAIDDYYNGYTIYGKNIKMYNNYSLISCLQELCITEGRSERKSFWADHFDMQYLQKLLSHNCIRKKFYELVANGHVNVRVLSEKVASKDVYQLVVLINDFVMRENCVDLFFLFLVDYGYLNIVKKEEEEWTLSIPNKEIAVSFGRKLHHAIWLEIQHIVTLKTFQEFANALIALERGKRETFQRFANSVASLFANAPEPQTQLDLQIPFFFFVLCMLTSKARTELYYQQQRNFRLDHIIMREDGTGIVLELKANCNSARVALKQIFTSEYYKVYSQINITKDKIHIGLHYKNKKVTIAALATDKDIITENDINENELIELVSA